MSEKPVTETWVAPLRPLVTKDTPAYLIHIYPVGATMGTRYALRDKPLLIGRDFDCDVCIPDHSVSRRHARLDVTPEGVFVSDLGSTNGTFVNDVPVRSPTRLADGDYLRVGNSIFRFLGGGNVEAEYHEEIYRLTIIDALTQAHNRRALAEFLDRELVRSERHRRPVTLILLDIDHFKSVNDQFGHLAGDFALRELVQLIRSVVRREDLLARYGGEEFAIVLVETGLPEAAKVAERIRQLIEEHVFRCGDAEFRLTASLGLAATPGGEELTTTEMIQRADKKLYHAKQAGRNRVEF